VLWTIRLSALLYAVTVYGLWRRHPWARALSALAYALYLAHVYLAFDQRYAWSHAVAYAETARQTRELFGLDWGGGLYWNYLFTLLWPLDLIWPRRSWSPYLHAYLIFMFLNGAIVFAKWWR
jgi:hypothetical protein